MILGVREKYSISCSTGGIRHIVYKIQKLNDKTITDWSSVLETSRCPAFGVPSLQLHVHMHDCVVYVIIVCRQPEGSRVLLSHRHNTWRHTAMFLYISTIHSMQLLLLTTHNGMVYTMNAMRLFVSMRERKSSVSCKCVSEFDTILCMNIVTCNQHFIDFSVFATQIVLSL